MKAGYWSHLVPLAESCLVIIALLYVTLWEAFGQNITKDITEDGILEHLVCKISGFKV